jgi:type VI secretion system protein ImpM
VIQLGFYGKLPSHGDFIWNSTDAEFVTPWDEFLQKSLLRFQERNPENWLDIYLCSPIWRFMIAGESLGSNAWVGIVMPSVDTVGRYFPFTMASPLPNQFATLKQFFALEDWFSLLEQLALGALTQPMSAEQLSVEIFNSNANSIMLLDDVAAASARCEITENCIDMDVAEDQSTTKCQDVLLGGLLSEKFKSPCYWMNRDHELQRSNILITENISAFDKLFG